MYNEEHSETIKEGSISWTVSGIHQYNKITIKRTLVSL